MNHYPPQLPPRPTISCTKTIHGSFHQFAPKVLNTGTLLVKRQAVDSAFFFETAGSWGCWPLECCLLSLRPRLFSMPWPFLSQQLFIFICHETNQRMAGELTSKFYLSRVLCLTLLLFLLSSRYCLGRWVHAIVFFGTGSKPKWIMTLLHQSLSKLPNLSSSEFKKSG